MPSRLVSETQPAEPLPVPAGEPDPTTLDAPEGVAPQDAGAPQAGSPPGSATAQAAPRPAVGAAWLQTLIARSVQQIGQEDGWQRLRVDLEEGRGSVTFRVRREDDQVAVRVGFSDPALRALAQHHAERLHEALQTEYGTAVDFSLSGDAGPGGEHRGEGLGDLRPLSAAPADAEPDRPPPSVSLRTLIQGARHEWIG